MDPIFIILYAVIVTLVLALAFPRFRKPTPAGRRLLWISTILGAAALIVILVVRFVL